MTEIKTDSTTMQGWQANDLLEIATATPGLEEQFGNLLDTATIHHELDRPTQTRTEDLWPDAQPGQPIYGIWNVSDYPPGDEWVYQGGVVFHTTSLSIAIAQLVKERNMRFVVPLKRKNDFWIRRIDLWAAEQPSQEMFWRNDNDGNKLNDDTRTVDQA